ncbi:hypothetical protein [Aestuariivita boseongensis]|uniref:hypothetical protein n=1 Tax=Aestuariivita boseongensis TaxID=1470562 RepID=UPI0006813C01|nr:hypothetical protein [Aestuariivita boseongensis]
MGAPAVGAEEVRYYANGWPIALVEAACSGDEGCLTLFANCPPGTDGTCTAQVAWCSLTEHGLEVMRSLCVSRTRGSTPDISTDVMMPSGGSWNISRNGAGMVQVNAEDAQLDADGCVTTPYPPRRYCVEPVTDKESFERWANAPDQ